MEYNQQRRPRNSGYNNGRQMNYGRQTGCDSCARQMERENCGCQMQRNSFEGQMQRNTCGCERSCTYMRQKGYLEESESYPIGMSYTPWQSWKCTYDSHRGLMSGTIFPELEKPFCAAGRCMR